VVLQGAGDDLGGRGGAAVDQQHDGEGLAAVAARGDVVLVGIGAAALGNDGLSLGEQVIADFYCLGDQAAGVVAQVEHQAFQVAEAVDGFNDFAGGGFFEDFQVNVADAGANLIGEVDGRVGDLIADQVEDQQFGLPLAGHADLYVGAFGTLERFGHQVVVHAVGVFAVDGGDDVAGMDAGLNAGEPSMG